MVYLLWHSGMAMALGSGSYRFDFQSGSAQEELVPLSSSSNLVQVKKLGLQIIEALWSTVHNNVCKLATGQRP